MRTVNFAQGEKLVQRISLFYITTSHNPRDPVPNLTAVFPDEGYEGWSITEFAQLGLSDVEADRKAFCRMLEKYESGEKGIVQLAASRKQFEIEPILLRDFRCKVRTEEGESYEIRYGIVAGERRFLSAVYNYAKHGADSPTIGAIVKKMTVAQAEDVAFLENVYRRDPTPLEVGEFLHKKCQGINPSTGKKWSLAQVARHYDMPYQDAMRRVALVYLPDKDKKRLIDGKVGLTKAIEKGMAIKRGDDPDAPIRPKKTNRRRVKTLTQVEALFDENLGKGRKMYRQALADVMGITLEQASDEAFKRQEAAELKAAEKVERSLSK